MGYASILKLFSHALPSIFDFVHPTDGGGRFPAKGTTAGGWALCVGRFGSLFGYDIGISGSVVNLIHSLPRIWIFGFSFVLVYVRSLFDYSFRGKVPAPSKHYAFVWIVVLYIISSDHLP